MNIETNIAPKDPSDQLLDAKEEARQYLLADDITYAVLREKLFDSNINDVDYPDFSVEPTLKRDDSMQSMFGLRVRKSRSTLEGEVESSPALYEHLDLGKLDRETGIAHASPELKGLVVSAGLEEGAALNVIQAWQRSIQIISGRMGDLVIIDPYSHTFELKSAVEQRASAL